MQYISEYATITAAQAAFTPAEWDKISVNGRLLVYLDGAHFEYPGRSDGAAGMWVPYQYRDARTVIVYAGDIDPAAAPNTSWGWTIVGGVTLAAGETQMLNPGAANANIQHTTLGLNTADHLIYMNCKVTAASGTNGVRLQFDGGDSLGGGRIYSLYLSYLGTAGDIRWAYDTNGVYAAGVAYVKLVFELHQAEACANIWLYDSQQMIGTCRTADFPGAAGNERIYVGCYGGAVTGTMYLDSFPAFAILEKP